MALVESTLVMALVESKGYPITGGETFICFTSGKGEVGCTNTVALW